MFHDIDINLKVIYVTINIILGEFNLFYILFKIFNNFFFFYFSEEPLN